MLLSFREPVSGADSISNWLHAEDGVWTDSNNWDTNFFPDRNNGGFETHAAVIAATGMPYTVTLEQRVWLESFTQSSADATLWYLENTTSNFGTLELQAGTFHADGNVSADSLSVGTNARFQIHSGATANVDRLTNLGTVRLDSGARLNLDGDHTSDQLGDLDNGQGGTVSFQGRLDNVGRSFTIDQRSGYWEWFGEVDGGEVFIAPNATQPGIRGLTLNSGATYHGDANLLSASGQGLMTVNAGASFTGDANLPSNTVLLIKDTQTWTGKTVSMRGGVLSIQDDKTLTLDAGTVVEGHGDLSANNGHIVNQGTLRGGSAGLSLDVLGNFANQGTIEAVNGGEVLLAFGEYAQNDGVVQIGAGSSLRVQGTTTVSRLGAIDHQQGGQLNFLATLDLQGSTLAFADTDSPWTFGGGGCCLGSDSRLVGGEVASGMVGHKLLVQKLEAVDVTFHGDLLLDSSSSTPLFQSNLTLLGQSTFTGERAQLIGTSSRLVAPGQTMVGKTFELEGGLLAAAGGTLDATTSVVGQGTIEGSSSSFIHNHGLIAATSAEGITVRHVSNFGELQNVELKGFVNEPGGIIRATSGEGVLIRDPSMENNGMIIIEQDATLDIRIHFDRAQLGSYDNSAGGQLTLGGALLNHGQRLSLGPNDGHWHIASGSIRGGEVEVLPGGSLTYANATFLDGVTFIGDLVIGEDGNLSLFDDSTFTGDAEITSAGLTFGNPVTLNEKSIRLQNGLVRGLQQLHLASDTVVSGAGAVEGGAVQNHGEVTADLSGRLVVQGSHVDNFGSLRAVGGSTIQIGESGHSGVGTWHNHGVIHADGLSTISLGGRFELPHVGTLDVQPGGEVNLVGSLDLQGASAPADDQSPWVLRGGIIRNGELLPSATGGTWRFGQPTDDGPQVSRLDNVIVRHDVLLEENTYLTVGAGSVIDGNVDLAGPSALIFATDTTLSDQVINLKTSSSVYMQNTTLTLTVDANSLVRGAGELAGPIHNEGTIRADLPGEHLTVRSVANHGRLENLEGASMTANFISGSRPLLSSGSLTVTSSIDVPVISLKGPVQSSGGVQLGQVFLGPNSEFRLTASQSVDLQEQLVFEMTDESTWEIGENTWLRVAGGFEASFDDRTTWARLEVGGEDLGFDPAGFSDNFEIPNLIIDPGAQLLLTDNFDNGNRGALGHEVLYVDELRFFDSNGVLNLNGLEIHYNTLIGDASQIIDVPVTEGGPNPDFDGDGSLNISDIDALVEMIDLGDHLRPFDLNGDGPVDADDLSLWLLEAGRENLASGQTYLEGDANLDGIVDGNDFIAWSANKFQDIPRWSHGDFNADGRVDGQDFVIWNRNKFTAARPVPESLPSGWPLYVLIALAGRWYLARRPGLSN